MKHFFDELDEKSESVKTNNMTMNNTMTENESVVLNNASRVNKTNILMNRLKRRFIDSLIKFNQRNMLLFGG